MSKVFKGKYVSRLRRFYKQEQIVFGKSVLHLKKRSAFAGLLSQVVEKDWVVYARRPFKSPKFVLDYLGRYTHRVAISNNRIQLIDGGQMTFCFKNRKAGSAQPEISSKRGLKS